MTSRSMWSFENPYTVTASMSCCTKKQPKIGIVRHKHRREAAISQEPSRMRGSWHCPFPVLWTRLFCSIAMFPAREKLPPHGIACIPSHRNVPCSAAAIVSSADRSHKAASFGNITFGELSVPLGSLEHDRKVGCAQAGRFLVRFWMCNLAFL